MFGSRSRLPTHVCRHQPPTRHPMPDFKSDFLDNYLKFGLGSMPKADIDALVMSLLDLYGFGGSGPMASLGNQTVSERLKTPVAKVKRLRYEAALKFGGRVEDQAQTRLLAALANATLEPDGKKICLIIEDSLAKNWLQGQLKIHQHIFDHSFNTEIVRVSADGLFSVLSSIFDPKQTATFRAAHEKAMKESDRAAQLKFFRGAAIKFAEGAAKSIGAGVGLALKAYLPIP